MILVDTGPLVGMVDRTDVHHAAVVTAASQLPAGPLLTTWPCFTEAMYFLFVSGGYHYQRLLWNLRITDRLFIHPISDPEELRIQELMARYQDTPMDLADASLVAAAESLGIRQIFSLDSDFYVYRLADGSAFQRIP